MGKCKRSSVRIGIMILVLAAPLPLYAGEKLLTIIHTSVLIPILVLSI